MGDITRNFSWREVDRSTDDAGHPAPMPLDLRPRMVRTVRIAQAIREAVEAPVVVTSGYRCPAHNRRLGASGTVTAAMSADRVGAHLVGSALDLRIPPGGSDASRLWAAWLYLHRGLFIELDQVIWYDDARGGHLHVATAAPGRGWWHHAIAGWSDYPRWTPTSEDLDLARAMPWPEGV